MREDIKIGATFPDYELPDHTDTPRKLSFLQGNDPMVLTLNRSVFCPKDRQQLIGLAAFYPQICVGYAR
jgi:peroxiredoxin